MNFPWSISPKKRNREPHKPNKKSSDLNVKCFTFAIDEGVFPETSLKIPIIGMWLVCG